MDTQSLTAVADIVRALTPTVNVSAAAALALKACNSEAGKAFYSEASKMLGPWHERRAQIGKEASFVALLKRVKANVELTSDEKESLLAYVSGTPRREPPARTTDSHDLRSLERLAQEENRQQEKLEAITSQAIDLVEDGCQIHTLDESWREIFSGSVRAASTEEMMSMLSAILAGEAQQPGAYSKHAVNTLRLLSQKDIQLLRMISSMAFDLSLQFANDFPSHSIGRWCSPASGMGFASTSGNAQDAVYLNLLPPTKDERFRHSLQPGQTFTFSLSDESTITARNESEEQIIVTCNAIRLTNIGSELVTLQKLSPFRDQFVSLCSEMKKSGLSVSTDNQVLASELDNLA